MPPAPFVFSARSRCVRHAGIPAGTVPMRADIAGRRNRWRRWLVEAALMVVVFFGIQYFVTRDVVRGVWPPLHGQTVGGAILSTEQWLAHADEASVLYVWATWCPVCKTVEANVDAVAESVPLLTVAMQSGGAERVGRFLSARGYRWTTLVDEDARLSGQLGVDAVPTLIFVDRRGQVRAVTQGYTSELGIRLRLWWASLGS